MRSKNVKLSNDLLKSEDAIHELQQEINKKDKFIHELEVQIDIFTNERKHHQEKQQDSLKLEEVHTNVKLNELNISLQNELSLKEITLTMLEKENNDLKIEINKLKERINENSLKYEQQIYEISLIKETETQYLQNERNKITIENEKLENTISKLRNDKQQLEDELLLYNEKKEAISKCEQQMNEILQMVNEERLVRDNLKYLASKLIQEVDTLRSQCIYTTTSTGVSTSNNLVANGTPENNNNNHTWRSRCSERRDRINVQNLQVALEKEIQMKEDLVNENKSLKLELDLKQTRINELQLII